MTESIIQSLLESNAGLLFSVIAIGLAVGNFPIGKFRLGGSGVLLAGLIFGHFGYTIGKDLQTLGVVLFVYATGLKAGPYIVESLVKSRGSFIFLALVIVGTGSGMAYLLQHAGGISPRLSVGIFAGAMTSTPALAAAIEALGDSTASVGYGLAYPFGILGVVLLVQAVPRLLGISLKEEAKRFREGRVTSSLTRKAFRVTNPNVTHLSLADLMERQGSATRIVRVKRGEKVFTPHEDDSLALKDLILVVGTPHDMHKLDLLFGEATDEEVPYSAEAASRWIVVSNRQFVGRKIGHLEVSSMYGVIISRIMRGDLEIAPSANFVLEAGDAIRISGTPEDLNGFQKIAQRDAESLYQTDFLSLAIGLTLGVLLGLVKIPLTEKLNLSLGIAGGPLLTGLVWGHFGRFGRLSGKMPKAAMNITGELGLYIFLAVAGTLAGVSFLHVLKEDGLFLIGAGALVTAVPILTGILVGRYILRINFMVLLGMICGGMTSTPGIAVLTSSTKSDIPALGYTGIYPLAVLLTTLMAQVLVFF